MKSFWCLSASILLFACVQNPVHEFAPARNEPRHPTAANLYSVEEDFDSSSRATDGLIGIFNNPVSSPIVPFLETARETIDIEIYEMYDREVRRALRRALDRHVRVRIVKEPKPIGQKCDPWGHGLSGKRASSAPAEIQADCVDQQNLVTEIRAAGGAFEPFQKKNLCGQTQKHGNCFEHGKMILVDARRALLSTGNFNSSNLCDLAENPATCNRDYSYVTRDESVIKALADIFEHDLAGNRYDVPAVLTRYGVNDKLTVSPFSFEPLAAFLRSARSRIQLQNQYVYPNSGLADILIEKAKLGVHVEIQLADACSFGHVRDKQAYELSLMFAALENAGVQIRMFNKAHRIDGKAGYLHAKAIVIDGEHAWVGSTNGSATSINENREFGLFYSNPQRVTELSRYLGDDFQDPASQAWRDSLRCRNLHYQDPQASRTEDDSYVTFLRGLAGPKGSPAPTQPDEEE